jgi:DNA-binding NtrC family response regulator
VVAKAAALLKLRRTTLVEKMRKYELRAGGGDGDSEDS